MKRSGNKGRNFNRYTEINCIKCGDKFYKTISDDNPMCHDCRIQDSVDKMTRRIKFQ